MICKAYHFKRLSVDFDVGVAFDVANFELADAWITLPGKYAL